MVNVQKERAWAIISPMGMVEVWGATGESTAWNWFLHIHGLKKLPHPEAVNRVIQMKAHGFVAKEIKIGLDPEELAKR